MALVASGLLNKQIAAELGLSEITIKVHRAKVMQKSAGNVPCGIGSNAERLDSVFSQITAGVSPPSKNTLTVGFSR